MVVLKAYKVILKKKKKKKVQISLRGARESTSVAFLCVGVRAICLGLPALIKYSVCEYKFANIIIEMQGQLRFLKCLL